jgi:hypothetical protein
VRRGQEGRVGNLIPGGRCYGFDPVPGSPASASTAKADVVRRIHREYAAGRSPFAIVADLNRDGIPAPRGGQWNVSTLLGSPKRLNGTLNNKIYAGILVYKRQQFVKDPATGKPQARPNRNPNGWKES